MRNDDILPQIIYITYNSIFKKNIGCADSRWHPLVRLLHGLARQRHQALLGDVQRELNLELLHEKKEEEKRAPLKNYCRESYARITKSREEVRLIRLTDPRREGQKNLRGFPPHYFVMYEYRSLRGCQTKRIVRTRTSGERSPIVK